MKTGTNKTLQPWGLKVDSSFDKADNFACPYHCKGSFSYFCNGIFLRKAAIFWQNSVVGFTPNKNACNDNVGTVVLYCSNCSRPFTLVLNVETIEEYKRNCQRWPVDGVSSTYFKSSGPLDRYPIHENELSRLGVYEQLYFSFFQGALSGRPFL